MSMNNTELLEKYIYDFGWDLWWMHYCKDPNLPNDKQQMFTDLITRLESGLKQVAEQMREKKD